MRKIPLLLLGLLTTAVVFAERPLKLDDVLKRHAAALGTPAAAIEVDLLIVEPAFTVTGEYRASRDGSMRIDVFADGQRVFTEALDEEGGWQQHGEGAEILPLSDTGRAALRRGIVGNLYSLQERPELGYTLKYHGRVPVDGKPYWKISSQAPDGFEEVFYLDTETALISRKAEVSALHPDIDATLLDRMSIYSDYRRVNGRMFAHRSETIDTGSGETVQTTTISNVELTPLR